MIISLINRSTSLSDEDVQAENCSIDGVDVSNFVLPSYFSPGEQIGRRTHPGRSQD